MNRRRKIINTLMVTIIMNMYELVDVVVVVLLLLILSSFVFTCEICTWFGINKFDCF